MSALGQERPIRFDQPNVCFAPKADIVSVASSPKPIIAEEAGIAAGFFHGLHHGEAAGAGRNRVSLTAMAIECFRPL